MKKTIVWEKWRDNEHYIEASEALSDDINDQQYMEDDDDDEEENQLAIGVTVYPHIVRTPLGEFSVLDNNLPSKMFDCWVGHTNFPITYNEVEKIDDESDGVECLRIMSKYRFFIGVGKLFKFREVANQLTQLLCEDTEIFTEKEIREIMGQQKDIVKWAAVALDSGGFEYIATTLEQDSDFEERLEEFKRNNDKVIES